MRINWKPDDRKLWTKLMPQFFCEQRSQARPCAATHTVGYNETLQTVARLYFSKITYFKPNPLSLVNFANLGLFYWCSVSETYFCFATCLATIISDNQTICVIYVNKPRLSNGIMLASHEYIPEFSSHSERCKRWHSVNLKDLWINNWFSWHPLEAKIYCYNLNKQI